MSKIGVFRCDLEPPVPQVVLGVVEDLAGLRGVLVPGTGVSRHDRRVVEQPQEPLAVAGEDGLLLGAFDDGGELGLVRLFQLLASLQIPNMVKTERTI